MFPFKRPLARKEMKTQNGTRFVSFNLEKVVKEMEATEAARAPQAAVASGTEWRPPAAWLGKLLSGGMDLE